MSTKPALGLYFTDQFVEVSQISANGTKLALYGQLALPVGSVVNGEIKDKLAFQRVLKQLLSSTSPRPVKSGEKTVIGVSDNRVFLREFTVPRFAGKEVEEAVDYQVRSLLPVLPTGVETDWQIIGSDQEGQIEVLLTAIPKAVVASYLAVVSGVGLNVIAIEPAVFANIRIIKPQQLRGKDVLLVYLGDTYAEFTYVTNGHSRFSDYLPDSEIVKKGGIQNAIRDYVVFANTKHATRPIREIIISGFSNQIEALVESYQAQRVAAALANSRLLAGEVKDHSLLHTSAGLSLKIFDGVSSFNLLPMEFRLAMVRERLIGRWKKVLDLLIFLTILGIGGLFYVYRLTQSTRAGIEVLTGSYRTELNESANRVIIEESGNLNTLTDQLLLLREATGGESAMLAEIAAIAPAGLSLTSLVYTRGPGSIRLADPNSTWSMTGTASSRELVLDFYNKLLLQPDFARGRLYFGSLERETEVNFQIASQATL